LRQFEIQLTRYVAGRSLTLHFAQIPLLTAFSGREDIFIWLMGLFLVDKMRPAVADNIVQVQGDVDYFDEALT
jgi:hypothetical protein